MHELFSKHAWVIQKICVNNMLQQAQHSYVTCSLMLSTMVHLFVFTFWCVMCLMCHVVPFDVSSYPSLPWYSRLHGVLIILNGRFNMERFSQISIVCVHCGHIQHHYETCNRKKALYFRNERSNNTDISQPEIASAVSAQWYQAHSD